MDLILHIGSAKAGSTAVQSLLDQNVERLADRGVWVARSLGGISARHLAPCFMEPTQADDFSERHGLTASTRRQHFIEQTFNALRDELAQARWHGCSRMVISSEHLQSRLLSESSVLRCIDALSSFFEAIHLVLYLRRQDRALLSRTSEYLRGGWVAWGDQEAFTHARAHRCATDFYNYHELASRWSAALDRLDITATNRFDIRVLDERSGLRPDVADDFFTLLGAADPPPTVKNPSRPHAGLPLSAQAVLWLFNRWVSEGNRARPSVVKMREVLLDRVSLKYQGASWRPAQLDAERFYGQFEKANQQLKRRWHVSYVRPTGIDAPAYGDTLFDNDFSTYPQSADRVEWRRMIRDFREILIDMDADYSDDMAEVRGLRRQACAKVRL